MDDSGGQVYVSSTYLTEEVSIALDVLVCVEPLTSPLKPALADTESDTSLPEVTVIPIVVFPFLSRSPLSSFKKLKRKAHSAKRSIARKVGPIFPNAVREVKAYTGRRYSYRSYSYRDGSCCFGDFIDSVDRFLSSLPT
jgi:hypothetical protein